MTIQKDDSSMLPTAVALGVGVAAGFIAGLLFAPASGRVSRAKIAHHVRECALRVQQKVQHKKDVVKHSPSKLAETLSKVVHESQEALKQMQGKTTSGNSKNGNGKKS